MEGYHKFLLNFQERIQILHAKTDDLLLYEKQNKRFFTFETEYINSKQLNKPTIILTLQPNILGLRNYTDSEKSNTPTVI